MPRSKLEVADIFRAHGAAYRNTHAGHLNLPQLKVMSAVENCRTAALGGHVTACTKCEHQHVAYNSCRNRHCPKCQGAAAQDWMQARMADLLPVEYFHVVFTLPVQIADIAYQNKAVGCCHLAQETIPRCHGRSICRRKTPRPRDTIARVQNPW